MLHGLLADYNLLPCLAACRPFPVAVSGLLRVVMVAIADVVGKPPTESVFFEKYARICVVVDEVINEVRLKRSTDGMLTDLWRQVQGIIAACKAEVWECNTLSVGYAFSTLQRTKVAQLRRLWTPEQTHATQQGMLTGRQAYELLSTSLPAFVAHQPCPCCLCLQGMIETVDRAVIRKGVKAKVRAVVLWHVAATYRHCC